MLIYVPSPFILQIEKEGGGEEVGKGKREGAAEERHSLLIPVIIGVVLLDNLMMVVNQLPVPVGKLEEEVTQTSSF